MAHGVPAEDCAMHGAESVHDDAFRDAVWIFNSRRIEKQIGEARRS